MTDNATFREGAWAVILAAGSGTRMAHAAGCPKQFLEWKGAPLYWHSVMTFARCAKIDGIVLVFPPELCEREQERAQKLWKEHRPGISWKIATGGITRQESAANGLKHVPPGCARIFIHDAARPFFGVSLVWRLLDSLDFAWAGVIPAMPLTDTVKLVENVRIVETLPRERLAAAQTPQLFRADVLRKAHAEAIRENWQVTDDASMVERLGENVRVCEGEPGNIKITRPEDLAHLREDAPMWLPCNGFGYDAHRFGPGRPLKLGGVPIPDAPEIIAHSDGDVLMHALMDALLGAAALGDIGKLFPSSEAAYEGISSALLLDRVYGLFRKSGLVLTHIDLTVIAQKPRLESWKGEIARNVARLLSLNAEQVALKATTEEKMGFTGRLEGIKACALASAVRKVKNPGF